MHAPSPRLWFKQMHAEAPCRKCLHAHTQTHTHTLTRTHAHTHTHTRATECPLSPVPRRYSTPGTQQQAYTSETPLLQYADQTAHASSHRKTDLSLRKKMFCAKFLDVLHSSHRGQLVWFYFLNIKVNPFTHSTHMVAASCYLWTVMKAEATEKGVGGLA